MSFPFLLIFNFPLLFSLLPFSFLPVPFLFSTPKSLPSLFPSCFPSLLLSLSLPFPLPFAHPNPSSYVRNIFVLANIQLNNEPSNMTRQHIQHDSLYQRIYEYVYFIKGVKKRLSLPRLEIALLLGILVKFVKILFIVILNIDH